MKVDQVWAVLAICVECGFHKNVSFKNNCSTAKTIYFLLVSYQWDGNETINNVI